MAATRWLHDDLIDYWLVSLIIFVSSLKASDEEYEGAARHGGGAQAGAGPRPRPRFIVAGLVPAHWRGRPATTRPISSV